MKKIFVLICMAVMSTSLFALDVTGKIKIDGSLFNWDTSKQKVEMYLSNGNVKQYPNSQTGICISAQSENAGGSFIIDTSLITLYREDNSNIGYRNGGMVLDKSVIWAKPVDWLKLTVGYQNISLNCESIEYSDSTVSANGYGYGIQLFFEPVTVDFLLKRDFSFDGRIIADGKLTSPLVGKIKVSGDWGNINLYGSYLDSYTIAVGYDGNTSYYSYFTDVSYSNETKSTITADAFFGYSQNGFGLKVYAKNDYNITDSQNLLGFKVYADYALANGLTPSILIKSDNILSERFALYVKPNLSGSWGVVHWNAGIQLSFMGETKITIAGDNDSLNLLPSYPYDFAIAVPVDISISL